MMYKSFMFAVIVHRYKWHFKDGFHLRRSHSRHKRASDLVRIKNQSRKWSHKLSYKLNGIGVGRIRTFPFLPIPFTTPLLVIQWKQGCWSWKQKQKNQPIAKPGIVIGLFFCFCLRLHCSCDHKWWSHKQNHCSASDSIGVIFIRLYHSTLLITTPSPAFSAVLQLQHPILTV